ncbi:MAG: PHB depolymerase family esterase [Bryobacteraceae bacterium]
MTRTPVLVLLAATLTLLATSDPAVRRDFESPVDGSVQPYRLYVPPESAQDPLPLVVVLHGAHGDENTYFDRYLNPRTGERVLESLARERGYIVASPRRYQGEYERDVLAMIDDIAESHPVRRDQVFLTGHSSGGVGTWHIGYRNPQRFAALAAVGSAFTAQPYLLHSIIRPAQYGKPMMYVQGVRDELVPNRQARALVTAMQPQLSNFVYREFPDAHGSLGTTSLPAVFDFFDSVRNEQPVMESDDPTEAEFALVKAAKGKRTVRLAKSRKPVPSVKSKAKPQRRLGRNSKPAKRSGSAKRRA